MNIFYGFMRDILTIMYFFIPEWIPLFGPIIKMYTNYFRQIFWESMNIREKTGYKRGDFIDFLLTLKNGEQDPIYSKTVIFKMIRAIIIIIYCIIHI